MSDLVWINLDEQMPPTDTPVLVRACDGTVVVAALEYKRAEAPRKDWVWWNAVGFSGYEWEWAWDDRGRWRGATHWCLLPEIALPSESGE